MNEERQEVYKILELGTDEKNLHKHKNTGGLLYIDLSMIKFSNLSTYIRKQDKEIERLNKRIKELEEGFKATTKDLCEESTKIEKAIDYINKRKQEREKASKYAYDIRNDDFIKYCNIELDILKGSDKE